MTLLTLALLASPAQAEHPPGTVLDDAVAVDITPEGLEQVVVLAEDLIPSGLPLPEIYEADAEEECIWNPFGDDLCWNWYEFILSVSGLEADIGLAYADLVPTNGELELDVGIELSVASASQPGTVYAFLEVVDLISLEEDCDVWVDPTPIGVTTTVGLALDPATGVVDATIDPISVDLDLSNLVVQGCTLGDLLDFVDSVNDFTSSFLSFDLYAFVADLVEPFVEDTINGLLPELETTLEDLLSSLVIEETLAVLDTEIGLSVSPSTLDIVPEGIRLGLSGAVDPGPLPHPCISKYGITGSVDTGTFPPAVGEGSATYGHGLGLFVDDDLVNQVLFAAWYGGVMCFTLDGGADDLGIDLPIALDTSLLGLLASGAYDDLFDAPAPLTITTRPARPPEGYMDGPHDVDLEVRELGLDMLAEIDGRMSRVVGFAVEADAGADLAFDGATGDLAVDLAFGADDLDLSVVFNDLKPEASADLEGGIGGLVDTILTPLLGGLTEGLAFALPSLEGLGLTSLETDVAGPDQDYLGAYASLGVVSYDNALDPEAGCTGGCSEDGGGCASGGGAAGWLWFTGLSAAALRRRRDPHAAGSSEG